MDVNTVLYSANNSLSTALSVLIKGGVLISVLIVHTSMHM